MKNILPISVSVVTVIAIVIFFVSFRSGGSEDKDNNESQLAANAVTVENGTQYVSITAKGGYTPRAVTAKAGTKTVIRIKSAGAFDCSSTVVIPSLSFQKSLQADEVAEISVPIEKTQGKLQGVCGMGMYNFVVNFEE